jgi:hypothetical protein
MLVDGFHQLVQEPALGPVLLAVLILCFEDVIVAAR